VSYSLKLHRLFAKELLKLPSQHQQKIYRLSQKLKTHPTARIPNTTLIKGHPQTYRTRFGNFRLIYHLNHKQKQVIFLAIQSRGQVYKALSRLLS